MVMRKIPSPEECPELYDDYDGEPPKGWKPMGMSPKVKKIFDKIRAERSQRQK